MQHNVCAPFFETQCSSESQLLQSSMTQPRLCQCAAAVTLPHTNGKGLKLYIANQSSPTELHLHAKTVVFPETAHTGIQRLLFVFELQGQFSDIDSSISLAVTLSLKQYTNDA